MPLETVPDTDLKYHLIAYDADGRERTDDPDGPTARRAAGALKAGGYTDVLLQNVRALGIDQLADERTEKPSVAKAVTLEVTTTEAQKLALAQTVGQLSRVVRQAPR